jgi:putative mRNA 3-end processing factor
MALLVFNKNGIYCPAADVYIDPWKPVKKALITHGHSDHARYGSKQYLASKSAVPVIKYRLGTKIQIKGVDYGEKFRINGVQFSFHPAGHIIGSAQIRVEHKGEIWVVSGDYKTEDDGISEAFEAVKCHTFITECTFGLPVYQWPDQDKVYTQINQWWARNQANNKQSLIIAYSLGKAQRVLHHLDTSIGKIYTHGAVDKINSVLRAQGVKLPDAQVITGAESKEELKGSLVIAPSSATNSIWAKRFQPYSEAFVSGWMNIRGMKRRRAVDQGFVLSDHADWTGLLEAIEATQAEKVITTHGYTEVFARHLNTLGIDSYTEKTAFEGELLDERDQES